MCWPEAVWLAPFLATVCVFLYPPSVPVCLSPCMYLLMHSPTSSHYIGRLLALWGDLCLCVSVRPVHPCLRCTWMTVLTIAGAGLSTPFFYLSPFISLCTGNFPYWVSMSSERFSWTPWLSHSLNLLTWLPPVNAYWSERPFLLWWSSVNVGSPIGKRAWLLWCPRGHIQCNIVQVNIIFFLIRHLIFFPRLFFPLLTVHLSL